MMFIYKAASARPYDNFRLINSNNVCFMFASYAYNNIKEYLFINTRKPVCYIATF